MNEIKKMTEALREIGVDVVASECAECGRVFVGKRFCGEKCSNRNRQRAWYNRQKVNK